VTDSTASTAGINNLNRNIAGIAFMAPPGGELYQDHASRGREPGSATIAAHNGPPRSAAIKRFTGITVSAVVAILGSIVSILLGFLMVIGWVAMRTAPPAASQPVPPIPPVATLAVLAMVYCAFGAWGIASAVGLLLRRNWARLCFVIFGGLLAFFSFCVAAGSLLVAFAVPATTPLPDNVSEGLFRGLFAAAAVISVACFGVAIWWLVYFNRSTVKASFVGEVAASRPRQFPLAVSIVAWLMIAGSVIAAVEMLVPYPLLIFGIVFRGWAASLLLALFAAVGLAAGIGMLKKRIEAHSLAVGYLGFGLANAASYFVVPGSFARLQEVLRETQGDQALPLTDMSRFMRFGIFVGFVSTSAILILLIRARKPFVDACQLNVE
jgi:MFS family permease